MIQKKTLTRNPWKEIARPHEDMLEGMLKQSDFAVE